MLHRGFALLSIERKRLCLWALLAWTAAALLPQPAAAVDQWRRWEQTIRSTRNYTQGGGNPYRDLILRIQFTQQGTGATYIQDAFFVGWAPVQLRSVFKVRGAFPPGTWNWSVQSCQGTTGSPALNCATDTSWAPSSGSVVVTATTGDTVKLFGQGRLTHLNSMSTQGTSISQLLYSNLDTFFWAGDTAWTAPPREISTAQHTGQWVPYLQNRRGKAFSVILVAPSVAWEANGAPWPDLPDAEGFSFSSTPCGGVPLPNNCSVPVNTYWDAFDQMVQDANIRDLVVGIVGVMDPVGLGSDGTFPNQANAVDFARYLAARLAGNHVVLSPGFDTWVTHRTFDNAHSAQQVMNAVGNAIKAAAPHLLVTNHLAGQSPCTDYQLFKNSGWMSFYLFQSGHAAGQNGTAGQVCPGRLSGESSVRAAMRRAREMPLVLRSYTNPTMSNINGEGPYDGHPSTSEPDNRYRVRQAAHLSLLSGSAGFTYGATRLWSWDNPSATIYDLASAVDMTRLFNRLRPHAPLAPHHDWILNQIADPNHERKMVLASDGNFVFAYLPSDAAVSTITISTTQLSGLTCAGTNWTKLWFDPRSNAAAVTATCTQGTNQITLTKPTSCNPSTANCDWLLRLQKVS